jgi:hypothetical protein
MSIGINNMLIFVKILVRYTKCSNFADLTKYYIMKKTTLIIALVFAGVTTFAQDLTSKKGEAYLPEAGEWAIGIDADPFLNYIGNFIGGDGLNTAPTFTTHGEDNVIPGVTLFGKMFIDANTAYRGKVRLGFGSTKTTTMVGDADINANLGDMVENESKVGGTNIVLGGGIEKRKGNSRLQGVYGAQAQIGLSSSKTTNEYGNDAEDELGIGFSRILESKSGGMTSFGLGAFIGAEYFIAPKMSIGGEYNWGLMVTSTGAGSVESETAVLNVNGDIDIDTETVDGPTSSSSFGIDTGLNGSFSLRLMLHF